MIQHILVNVNVNQFLKCFMRKHYIDSTVAFFDTHLHGSPCRVRPRPFLQAHKQEASDGVFGTINSPKVTLKGSEKGPE